MLNHIPFFVIVIFCGGLERKSNGKNVFEQLNNKVSMAMKLQGSTIVRIHLEDGFEETYHQVHGSLIKLSSEIKQK